MKGNFNIAKLCVYLATAFTMASVVFIVGYILINGLPQIFIEINNLMNGLPSLFDKTYNSTNVSLVFAVWNTLIMTVVAVGISSILGVFTAIYLVEYAKSGNKFVELIRITSETLSGIPSIIYGLFGMIFFVTFLGWKYVLLSGILTIAIMILPLIMRSTEEALKAVPQSYREASFGLGAGKLRTIFLIVLPAAMNGIIAGIILAIGRVIGETAALIYTSGTTTLVASNIQNMGGRTLAVHMYMLSSEGIYINQTYATAAILLLIVLMINGFSTILAKKLMGGKAE